MILKGYKVVRKKRVVGVIGVIMIGMMLILRNESEKIQITSAEVGVEQLPKVAITFDDGPSVVEGTTEVLLDGLAERGVKASFFVLGKQAEESPDLILRMYEEGHLIGNHSYSHVNLAELGTVEAVDEIERTNAIIEGITGEKVEFIRPPFGAWREALESEINMMPVMWSIDPLDWNTTNVEAIVNKVVTETEENDIILLHDSFPTSVEAALLIIDELQEKGFEFVTVDELLMN